MEFRTLRKDEIQVRPTDTKYKGSCTLLLYQDARVFMDILDETVGNERWQKEYYEVKGNVYCRIGIKTDIGEWVWKSDCGTESNMDAEKGEASDAGKRAAVAWGIGRELYSCPKIKVKGLPDSYYYNDKLTMTFSVKEIEYQDRKIAKLVIADRNGNVVYTWEKEGESKPESRPVQLKKDNKEVFTEFCTARKTEEGVDVDDLLRFYKYWLPKVEEGWDGPFKPEKLWMRWCNTKRS